MTSDSEAVITLDIPEGVPLYRDDRGTIRVRKSRVLLDLVVGAYQIGNNAEEIAQQYPTVSVADVEAVLAYYDGRHQCEVDEYLRLRRERGDKLRADMESRFSPVGIRERLLARQRNRKQSE